MGWAQYSAEARCAGKLRRWQRELVLTEGNLVSRALFSERARRAPVHTVANPIVSYPVPKGWGKVWPLPSITALGNARGGRWRHVSARHA